MDNTPSEIKRVIAVGNFDGVHTGHMKVLKAAISIAEKKHLLSAAMTFYPLPRDFFGGEGTVKRITDEKTKSELILSSGINEHLIVKFDGKLAGRSSDGFTAMLKNDYDCDTVICGGNFRFGKNAAYGTEELKLSCEKYGIESVAVPYLEGVSSSRIRELIVEGCVNEAASLLGRPFAISGKVLHGRHIGTEIGFPTVNITAEKGLLLPRFGVYETKVSCGGMVFKGLTNVGVAPTVSGNLGEIRTETFLIDTDEDLYEKEIKVEFIKFIRSEKKFKSLELLKKQISTDLKSLG